MKKGTKTLIVALVIVLLIAGISWAAYEKAGEKVADLPEVNETPNENMGITNKVDDLVENEIANTVQNEIANETTVNEVSEENNVDEENNNTSDSEVITGTNATREEKAVEIAKKYYEKTYGSTEGIYFTYDSVNGDGRYRVIAGTAGSSSNKFLIVNINTGEVTEK